MKQTKLALALGAVLMMSSGFAMAAAAVNAGGNSGNVVKQPNATNTGGSGNAASDAAARKAEKANSPECAQKRADNDREHADHLETEEEDSHHVTMSHDSHGSAHHADTHHDDMVREHRNMEAKHEEERKLICGDIDDGKSLSNEHDDEKKRQDSEAANKNAENNQRRE